MNEKGEAVRLQCTLCHALPQVERENGVAHGRVDRRARHDAAGQPRRANWMHDHRSKIDSSCAMCHGPIKWGKDGGSFCSNPACHGRKWPEMDLDAKKS